MQRAAVNQQYIEWQRDRKRPLCFLLWQSPQISLKIFAKKPKFCLTYVHRPVIIHKRLCGAQTYYAMKREIARRRGNFRGVCPVPVSRYAIGRLKPLRHTRISRVGSANRPEKAGLFFGRGLIRTVVCIWITKGFIRTHKDGPNAVTKNVRKGEKHPWQQQRT